jgi:hypothetical protein
MHDIFNRLATSVQPLVFETGVAEVPYSIAGTGFLVGYKGRVFFLTTRHSLRPESVGPLCIFPTDFSQKILPLGNVFFVPQHLCEEDFVDLAVVDVNLTAVNDAEQLQARLIDMDRAVSDWCSSSDTSVFSAIGYPDERSFIDYHKEAIYTERVFLSGRYVGLSSIPYLHELEVSNPLSLTTFSGFSGSPVFCYSERDNAPTVVSLCGMVLRGTPVSGRIHFLDSSVLLDALELAAGRS